MQRLIQKNMPIWRRTILEHMSMSEIGRYLEEIAESGDYHGYEGEDRGEYYEEYRELFDQLTIGAQDLMDEISVLEEYGQDEVLRWDDFTVALLGGKYKVLGYNDEDDFCAMPEEDEDYAVRVAQKRLEKMTKADLIKTFARVMELLMEYVDIKAAYDTLAAVVVELDNRAALHKSGAEPQRAWIE